MHIFVLTSLMLNSVRQVILNLFQIHQFKMDSSHTVRNISENTDCTSSSIFALEWKQYRIASVILTISFVTIIGNILVIVVSVGKLGIHHNMNRFAISLAVADLLVGVLVMPISLIYMISGHRDVRDKGSSLMCSIARGLDLSLTSTSFIHLLFMTLDRYICLLFPLKYWRIMNKRLVIILIICSWMIPIAFAVGAMETSYDIDVFRSDVCKPRCAFRLESIVSITGSVVFFYFPSFFTIFCHISIYRKIKSRRRHLQSFTSNVNYTHALERQHHTEYNVVKTIAALLGCYFVCWLPFFVYLIVDPLINFRTSEIVVLLVTWLGYINSGINSLYVLSYAFITQQYACAHLHEEVVAKIFMQ